MDAGVRATLLQNVVEWLTTVETPSASVSGTVVLEGEMDHSGVLIEAIPGGGDVYIKRGLGISPPVTPAKIVGA